MLRLSRRAGFSRLSAVTAAPAPALERALALSADGLRDAEVTPLGTAILDRVPPDRERRARSKI